MAQMIPHRSENDIKNKWNSMKRKEERSRRNKAPPTLARAGAKKPPPVTSMSNMVGKSETKKEVTFAMPQLVNENRPFDGPGEDASSMRDTV